MKEKKEKPKKQHLCFCSQCGVAFFAGHPDTLFCSEACLKKYGGISMIRRIPNIKPKEEMKENDL